MRTCSAAELARLARRSKERISQRLERGDIHEAYAIRREGANPQWRIPLKAASRWLKQTYGVTNIQWVPSHRKGLWAGIPETAP